MPTIKGRGKTDVYVVAKRQPKGKERAAVDVQFIRSGFVLKTVTLRPDAARELAAAIEEQAIAAEAKARR